MRQLCRILCRALVLPTIFQAFLRDVPVLSQFAEQHRRSVMREMRDCEVPSGKRFHLDAALAAATIARIPVFKAVGRIDQESQMIARSGSLGARVFWGVSVPSAPDCAPLALSDGDFSAFSADCSSP